MLSVAYMPQLFICIEQTNLFNDWKTFVNAWTSELNLQKTEKNLPKQLRASYQAVIKSFYVRNLWKV